MSGGFASLAALCNGQSVGASIAAYTSGGTSVPFSATANTKGAYTQLTAATAFDATAVLIKVVYGNNTGPDTAVAVDIAVGASGSEVVVVPNLNLNDGPSGTTYSTMVMYSLIPLTIPAGTRVSARSASNGTSGTGIINVSMVFLDGGFDTSCQAFLYDALGGSATGVGAAVAGGNGAKGAYTQVIASTTRDYCGIFITFDYAGGVNCNFNTDIAFGSSGSEVVQIGDIYNVLDQWVTVNTAFIPMQIPAGTRIAVRSASLNGSAENVGVTIFGAVG